VFPGAGCGVLDLAPVLVAIQFVEVASLRQTSKRGSPVTKILTTGIHCCRRALLARRDRGFTASLADNSRTMGAVACATILPRRGVGDG